MLHFLPAYGKVAKELDLGLSVSISRVARGFPPSNLPMMKGPREGEKVQGQRCKKLKVYETDVYILSPGKAHVALFRGKCLLLC